MLGEGKLSQEDTDRLGRLLRTADQLLLPVENALNLTAGLLIFGLMFLGMVQIVLRTLFRSPIFGYIDIVEFTMVAFALFSISYVQRLGGHVRMEIVVARLKGRVLWIAETIGVAVAICLVVVLIPYSYSHFFRSWSFGDSTIDIELPTWPGKLVVPIALCILLVRLIIQLFGYWRLVRDPKAEPIGVPVLKSVEEQAEEEIEGAKT